MAYASVSELREFLGDAFASVEDDTLTGYLDYASTEIDVRLSSHFAELPFDPVPALVGRICLYRAAAEVLVVYYGRAGAGTDDGRAGQGGSRLRRRAAGGHGSPPQSVAGNASLRLRRRRRARAARCPT